jgi:hypothetical protein
MFHKITYTDDIPEQFGGVAKWFWIRIRPKYKDDKGLHEHEIEHVRQWWQATFIGCLVVAALGYYTVPEGWFIGVAGLATHDLLYSLFPKYRLWAEVEAHKAQLKHYPDDRVPLFAKRIASLYDLKITAEEAERMLRA